MFRGWLGEIAVILLHECFTNMFSMAIGTNGVLCASGTRGTTYFVWVFYDFLVLSF